MRNRPPILEQIINPHEGSFSPEHARYVLSLRIPEFLKERYAELSEKSQEGSLSAEEQQELDEFLDADTFLSVLKSKARISLKNNGAAALAGQYLPNWAGGQIKRVGSH